jgi:WS/DGAT/MGAT family acyltransferase
MALELLPAQDSVLWWVQRPESPLQIAGLAMFEAGPLRDASGGLRRDELAARMDAALSDAPRFRQRVRQLPLAQGVAWEDDDTFDVTHHLGVDTVPAPGGQAELGEAVARVLEQRLDPDRPLWELWLLDGVAGDRVAVVLKASHVLLDGTALLDFAVRLLDVSPEPRPFEPAPPWRPAPPSGLVERMAAGVTARAGQVAGGLWQAGALVVDPRVVAGTAGAVVGLTGAVAGGLVHGVEDAPTRLPLTGRVGTRRSVVWTRVPLDDVRHVARAEGVTVNDVVLAMAAGALAAYGGAERVDGGPPGFAPADPRVIVPLSVHGGDAEARNRFAVTVTELPLGVHDPLARLHRIHTELLPQRLAAPSSVGGRVFAVAGLVPPWLLRLAGRVALDHQPVADLAVTNLRGPAAPLYLLGARMLEAYPLVSGTGNIATIVGVLSYDGSLGICITVDADVVPDPEALLEGFPRSLRALLDASDSAGADDAAGHERAER